MLCCLPRQVFASKVHISCEMRWIVDFYQRVCVHIVYIASCVVQCHSTSKSRYLACSTASIQSTDRLSAKVSSISHKTCLRCAAHNLDINVTPQLYTLQVSVAHLLFTCLQVVGRRCCLAAVADVVVVGFSLLCIRR